MGWWRGRRWGDGDGGGGVMERGGGGVMVRKEVG